MRILAVDDDPQILRYVRTTLSQAGYSPTVTVSPDEVESLIKSDSPHLILLDLELPGTNGFELMTRISNVSDALVIFLSGHGGDANIARALELGAYDYILKPFSPTELVARIRAALRKRASPNSSEYFEPYTLGDLTISYAERRVSVANEPTQLTATEYRLLVELAANAGRVLTQGHLLRRVWGAEYESDYRLLRSFIKNLRRKLGDDARNPSYILTEHGVGYRMPGLMPEVYNARG